MRGAVLHAPGEVRVEERADPAIVEPKPAPGSSKGLNHPDQPG